MAKPSDVSVKISRDVYEKIAKWAQASARKINAQIRILAEHYEKSNGKAR